MRVATAGQGSKGAMLVVLKAINAYLCSGKIIFENQLLQRTTKVRDGYCTYLES